MSDKISILGQTFTILDQIENVPVVDSFVKYNKIGRGSGEARLYIGPQEGRNLDLFFDNFNSNNNCFFLKKDFEDYLSDAKFEYEVQEQGYIRDISEYWPKYHHELTFFPNILPFTLKSAIGNQDHARYYVRSYDKIFREYFRSIALPIITYVSIMKLKNNKGQILFYFRLFLNYFYNPHYHPTKIEQEEQEVKEDTRLTESKKDQIFKSRLGQGKYRENLLNEISHCIITKVNDERILVASHIKPWSISTDNERLDHKNGLTFTPTYDKLFDQGFISFDSIGKILISPYISPYNIKRLGLTPGSQYIIPNISHRLVYLEFHRDTIFKK